MSSPSARLRSAMVSWRFAALLVVAVVTVLALAAPAFAVGNVTGRVVDEFGDPESGAPVYLFPQSGEPLMITSFTDESGNYAFFGVEDGLHSIQTYSDWYGNHISAPITIAGNDVHHNFYLGMIAVSGYVLDSGTFEPVPDCAVEAWYYNTMDGEFQYSQTVYSDSSGQYAFQQSTAPGSDPLYLKFLPSSAHRPEMYNDVADLEDYDAAVPLSWTSMSPETDRNAFLDPVVPVISGTVVDEMEGYPLEWTSVRLWYYDEIDMEYYDFAYTTTDEDGMYAFTTADVEGYSTPYYVSFGDMWSYHTPELYNDVAMGDWGSAQAFDSLPAADVDAALLKAPPAITGTVYNDSTGDPVEWSSVTAYQFQDFSPMAILGEWVEVGWGESYEDGYYELYAVPPGDTVVSAGSYGLVPEFFDDVEFGDFAAADKLPCDGDTITDIDFSLAVAQPAIGGTVIGDDTGEPLEGVEVIVWQYDADTGYWYPNDWAYTDEFGEYVLDETQVDGGAVRIQFDGKWTWPSYYSEFYDDTSSVKDATSFTFNGTFIGDINASLAPSAVGIEGTVTGSDTAAGIENVGVTAYYFYEDGEWSEWTEAAWAGTDSEGYYSIPDAQLESSNYAIYFDGRYVDYFSETYDDLMGLDFDNAYLIPYTGNTVSDVDAVLDPAPPAISGNVEDDDTGLAIEGVWVTAWTYMEDGQDSWWSDVAWALTDENGDYSFSQVEVDPDVDYVIMFDGRDAGYTSETYDDQALWDFDNAQRVQYSAGNPITGINAALLVLPEVVSGTVTDSQTGLPLEGASAYLWKYFYDEEEGWGDWGIVDGVSTYADGMYTLKDEPDGSPYKVSAERPDYQPRTTGQFEYAGDTLTRDMALDPIGLVDRVAGSTRFTGSVVMARGQFDPDGDKSWPDVTHIIIASGEDRAAADPLAAAGLCGAYNAPLFLVSAGSVSNEVKAAVTEIAEANDTEIVVHIVGGLKSVPDARYNDLVAAVGSKGKLSKDRILSGGGRFDLSAAIARRIMEVNDGVPPVVLIANGMDSTKFFDALALSPIAARTGFPLLLVSQNAIPDATQDVLDEIWDHVGGGEQVIVGGGPNTVSNFVKNELGAVRWSGDTRYTTAIEIANGAVDEGWLDRQNVGIAAKLPDALTGGAMVGLRGGVLVLTDGAKLTPATRDWLTEYREEIVSCEVFGGTKSVLPSTHTAISNALMP